MHSIFSVLQYTKYMKKKKKKKEKMATENIWKATGSKLAKDARQELSVGHESHDDGLKLVVVLWAVY